MNPYNTAERFMSRDYVPADTVTFKIHDEIRGDTLPPQVRAWAQSNLPDGDYVCQYMISDDAWHFGKAEWIGDRRRIMQVEQVYR